MIGKLANQLHPNWPAELQDPKIVTNDTSMTRMNDAGVAGLHSGMQVNARTSTDAQGHQVASFISIAPPAAAAAH